MTDPISPSGSGPTAGPSLPQLPQLRWIVTAQGPDHPGVVSSLTNRLAEIGCNLADTSMTRLGGRFVMLLSVDGPVHLDQLLQDVDAELVVSTALVEEDRPPAFAGVPWSVTVYGADHAGIVAAVTGELANWGVNIDDLSTRVAGDIDGATYVMLLDMTVPPSVEVEVLHRRLERLAERLAVTIHAQPIDVDTL